MALIDRKPRSLSARAEEPATVLTLNGADFRRLMLSNPEMSLVRHGRAERAHPLHHRFSGRGAPLGAENG